MRRKGCVLIPAIVVVGVLVFSARESILLAVGDFLLVREELQPADVIHVIAGPDDRTDYAIQLYKQGYAQKIFFTGGWCTFHNYKHGEHGAQRAEAQGVPPEAIVIDDSPVRSTYDEVLLLKDLVAKSEGRIRSVIAVSDAFHGRRALWTYRHILGKGASARFAAVPFEVSAFRRRWWTDSASASYVRDEYVKMLYYLGRYGLGNSPVQGWLASLDRE